jgi:DNA-binding transcriptional MerR regulator
MAKKIPIGEAARRLKRHPVTVKSWEDPGLLTSYRDYRGWRYYDEAEVERLCIDRQSGPRPLLQANSLKTCGD